MPVSTQTSEASIRELINVGDFLQITFADLPVGFQPPQPIVERVSEDGTIRLLQNQKFTAAGKRLRQLEEEIRERYVPEFYKSMTVTVSWRDSTLFFYVDGEVKRPDRQVYISRKTVLRAIASANGFTDFAHTTKVSLTHADGQQCFINCIEARKDPQLDLEVFPGDKIYVERKPTPFSR